MFEMAPTTLNAAKEIEIIVPWGKIAAEVWGDESDPPVLLFHGRMDNAGTFDNIIPLLPKVFSYISVDLPGHGKSSHFPAHAPLHSLDYIIAYKLIAEYFQRKRYIIMGHSYGAQLGLLFSRLYPEYVEKLVILDTLHLHPIEVNESRKILLDNLEGFLKLENKYLTRQQPTYTYEEAVQKAREQRLDRAITPQAINALLRRGLEPTGDGKYKFTYDQRLKIVLNPLHDRRYIRESLEHDKVRCSVLSILSKSNPLNFEFKEIKDAMEKYPNISIVMVEGHHDVHNSHAERVAPIISRFLLDKKANL